MIHRPLYELRQAGDRVAHQYIESMEHDDLGETEIPRVELPIMQTQPTKTSVQMLY